MRQPEYSGQFKRDVKQSQKRGKDMDKLNVLLSRLIEGDPLPALYLDHPLYVSFSIGAGTDIYKKTTMHCVSNARIIPLSPSIIQLGA